jgi:hypothetical protein
VVRRCSGSRVGCDPCKCGRHAFCTCRRHACLYSYSAINRDLILKIDGQRQIIAITAFVIHLEIVAVAGEGRFIDGVTESTRSRPNPPSP